ncbi:MAG: cobalt ECF transporter T component CbiQ [Nitrospirae bacterium]|nr:cobalt ECF transporter T component CbiQ [Nitrospirota bacterium]
MEYFSEDFRKHHMLTGIDARVKFIVAIAVLIMVISYKGFVFPLAVVLLNICLCMKMKVPFRALMLRLSEPLAIILVLILLKFLFSGREPLFSLSLFGLSVTGHKDGLIEGLMIAGRVLGAVSVIAVLGFSTPFTELMSGLSWMRIPKGFIEILMFAYRYIFVLFEDAMVIYNAQKNRLGYCSVRRGLNSFGTLAGSLILKAFDHSQNTTVAMVQRGYDGNMPLLRHKPFRLSEVVVSALFIIAMGCIWTLG